MIKEKMFRLRPVVRAKCSTTGLRSLFKVRGKKIILIGLLIAVVLAVYSATIIKVVKAQEEGMIFGEPGTATYQTNTENTKQVASLLSLGGNLAGKLLTLIAGLINVALNIGNRVLSLDIVKKGSQVVLNFANLGFVLAIIIMAFATIFRLQSYSMKQILWKLIVAALLVNFSLVIAGAFISVSNIFTDFFLSQTKNDMPTALANILEPQQALSIKGPVLDIVGGALNYFIQFAISLFFGLVITVLCVIIFAAIFIMLLVRAIYLAMLLIIMPIVWLFWIFPSTQKFWKEWWDSFIRWTFFAPIMLFFIYLVIATGNSMVDSAALSKLDSSGIRDAFEKGLVPTDFLSHTAKLVIVVGLLMGGLITANKMSITGAKTAYGLAQSAGKSFGGWVGRKGIRAGTWATRGRLGQKAVEGMQKTGLGMGRVGRTLTSPIRRLGGAVGGVGVQQGERLIQQAAERQKKLSDKQLALKLSTMARDEKVSALTRLAKNKNLNMVPDLARYIKDAKTKKIFESYGQGEQYEYLEKTAGFNTAVLNAEKPEEKKKAMEEFQKTHSIKDYDKIQSDIFGTKAAYGLNQLEHDEISKFRRESIFDKHPGAISKIRAKLKGENLAKFQEDLDEYIETFEKGNLSDNLRGIKVPIKVKLEFIDKERPQFSNWARGIYNSRKNFAGSLFGPSYYVSGGAGEAEEET